MKLSVVVPIYNEIENVVPLVASISTVLKQVHYDYELIAVDDGSTDGTREMRSSNLSNKSAAAGRRASPQLWPDRRDDAGIEHARGEVIVTIDGDLQNDPADIPFSSPRLTKGTTSFTAGEKTEKIRGFHANSRRCLPTY